MKKDDIYTWMRKFKSAWLAKDIDAVFNLLSDDVEYWQTPFQKIIGKGSELREAWENVLPLRGMQLTYEIFVSDETNRQYAVKWNFRHKEGESAGVYLVGLNKVGRCNYFYHSAQSNQ